MMYETLDRLSKSASAFSRRGLLTGFAAATAVASLPAFPHVQGARPASRDADRLKDYRKAAFKAVEWLAKELRDDGSYGPEVTDLASYYKSPWLFLTAGRTDLAYRVLGHIQGNFLRSDGDFTTAPGFKTADPALAEYYPYMNTWLTMATQKLGRFDIAQPAYAYIRDFFHELEGGFTLHAPYGQGDDILGAFISSHLGLASIYFGDLERARRAGDFLLRILDMQPDLGFGLYLRVDGSGDLITDFPSEQAVFHVVKTREPFQLYFFVGYPIGYLSRLFEATGDSVYLEGARAYHDFILTVDPSLYSFSFSHKVAWGSSVLARVGGDPGALETAVRIADYLVSIQHGSGGWLIDAPAITSFDQTAEIALWLIEIAAELA